MGEKKVDIKSLLEQNNVELHEGVTNKDLINKNTVDTSQVENYSPDNGMSVAEEEMMRVRGRKGGGVPNGVISAEQMASIEETLREIEAETELAKAEFEKFQQQKQEEEEKAKRLNPERREILDDESLSDEDEEMVEVEEFEDETESRGDFNKRYEEAVVIIDKTGMGNVIDFTDATYLLMALPNMIAIFILLKEIKAELIKYCRKHDLINPMNKVWFEEKAQNE